MDIKYPSFLFILPYMLINTFNRYRRFLVNFERAHNLFRAIILFYEVFYLLLNRGGKSHILGLFLLSFVIFPLGKIVVIMSRSPVTITTYLSANNRFIPLYCFGYIYFLIASIKYYFNCISLF